MPSLAASALAIGLLLTAAPALAEDSLDDLLGLDEDAAEQQQADEQQADEADPPADAAEPEIQLESDLDDLVLPTDEEGDIFQLVVTDMNTAAQRLGQQHDAGIETQRVQQRIITRLDQAIAQARRQNSEQQQQQASEDSGSQQNQPRQQQAQGQADQQSDQAAQDETASRGSIERGDMSEEELHERLSEWGNLPPRLRDQLMQGMEDNFSQLYRQLTERYYERLAEQQQ